MKNSAGNHGSILETGNIRTVGKNRAPLQIWWESLDVFNPTKKQSIINYEQHSRTSSDLMGKFGPLLTPQRNTRLLITSFILHF